jgi:hypothetical protein
MDSVVGATPVLIGSQRGVTFDSTAEMIDISDKTSMAAQFTSGKQTDTITLGTFYVEGETQQANLRSAYENGTQMDVDWMDGSTDGVSGTIHKSAKALVSSLSVSADVQSPCELDVTLQITGGWS